MTVRYYMPVVRTACDTFRCLRYVPLCLFRFHFRAGGCE
jgi:hypothetical protein